MHRRGPRGTEGKDMKNKRCFASVAAATSLRMTVLWVLVLALTVPAFGQGEAAGMPAGRAKQKRPMGSPSGAVEQATGAGNLSEQVTVLRCGAMLDVAAGVMRRNIQIVVQGRKIQ